MLIYRLSYKLLLVLAIFFTVFAVPFILIASGGAAGLLDRIELIQPLLAGQETLFENYIDKLLEDLIFLSFYVFVLAFLLTLFLSRSFLLSVKDLQRGTAQLREGRFDTRIESTTTDELGEVVAAFNDMAGELQRRDAELRSKDQYINAMVDPLWVVDNDNVVTDANPAFTRLFGYAKEEVVGSSIFDFLDEDAEKLMRRKFFEQEKVGDATYEISMISKSQGLIPVLLSVSPITSGDGSVTGRIGIIKDFRQEVSLREDIRREQESTEAIMDSMSDQMVVIDRDYRIVRANMAVRISAGKDIIGEQCHMVFHGHEQKCFLMGEDCPVNVVFETGKPYRAVHRHAENPGSWRFVEIAAYPVRDNAGNVRHAVEVMRDITERKKAEDELELRNREMGVLNEVSKVLAHSLGAEEVFGEVLEKMISITGLDGGGIYIMDEMHRDLRLRFDRGLSKDFVQNISVVKMGQDLPGKVAVSVESHFIPDISTDRRAEYSSLRHSGIKRYAAVPVRGKEKLIGVLFLFSFTPGEFHEEQRHILTSVSEMMGIAFENSRLYEKMKSLYIQNRQRRAEEQRNVMSLSTMLSSTLVLGDVLSPAALLIESACQAGLVLFYEKAAGGEGFTLLAASRDGFDEGQTVVTAAGEESLEAHALASREPAVLAGLASRDKFCLDERFTGYGNACSIPLFIGRKDIGALTLYFKSVKDPSEEDIHFLQTVGSILSVALERARLYEREVIQRGLADTIVSSITDGVMTVDTSGKVVSANPATGTILGVEPSDAIGFSLEELFGGTSDNTELQLRITGCHEDALEGNVCRAEGQFHAPDGGLIPLVVRSAPVYDDRKRTAGVVFVLRDLSSERELEVMKSDFVKSVSHEFRTPLTAIVGMTEMILDGEIKGKKASDYLQTVLQESKRLSDMVALVLDAAEIERGRDMLLESAVDFGALLRSLHEGVEGFVEKKQAAFRVHKDENIGNYRGDVEKLRQLLYNLVENALTFSDRGCCVEVNIERRDGIVRILVRDDGPGIEPDEVPYVTDKFYRGRNAEKARGMGLGLYVARGVARMHGGDLRIESGAGQGTTVIVDLPIRRN